MTILYTIPQSDELQEAEFKTWRISTAIKRLKESITDVIVIKKIKTNNLKQK